MIVTGLAEKFGRFGRAPNAVAATAEQKAFESVWQAARPQVWRLTARMTGSADAADDLTQEVGLRALQGLPKFRGDADRRTYLYRIAINAALRHNEQRLRSGTPESLDTPRGEAALGQSLPTRSATIASPEEQLLQSQRMPRIQQAIDALPGDLRAPLVLLVYEEMKYREIAELLEIPIGTVMSRIHAARQRLRRALPEEFNNENV